jgi:hypothetical protein
MCMSLVSNIGGFTKKATVGVSFLSPRHLPETFQRPQGYALHGLQRRSNHRASFLPGRPSAYNSYSFIKGFLYFFI